MVSLSFSLGWVEWMCLPHGAVALRTICWHLFFSGLMMSLERARVESAAAADWFAWGFVNSLDILARTRLSMGSSNCTYECDGLHRWDFVLHFVIAIVCEFK